MVVTKEGIGSDCHTFWKNHFRLKHQFKYLICLGTAKKQHIIEVKNINLK